MQGSYRLGSVFGIDLKVHLTFGIILLLGGLQWSGLHGAPGFAFGVLLMAALFACVVLHELGHSLMALRFGIPVKEIVLLPIGGVAFLKRQPATPGQELWIALAGPAVNVVLAVAFAFALGAMPGLRGLDASELAAVAAGTGPATALVWLFKANVMLVVFNLIPAFPLDGGRVFRALLSWVLPHARATAVAAGVGQVAAFGLGLLGVASGNLLLALVALFIFLGARAENGQVQAREALAGRTAGELIRPAELSLAPGQTAADALPALLATPQGHFPVLLGGRLLGVVSRERLLQAAAAGEQSFLAGIMDRQPLAARPETSLAELEERLLEAERPVAALYANDRFLGLVGLAELHEAKAVLQALRRGEGASRQRAA